MQKENIINRVRNFTGKKIIVVGDILLDNYIFGKVLRINPERAGYPLLTVEKEEYRLGGAGNVAVNLASLGARVDLYGAIGQDKEGEIVKELCIKRKVNLIPITSGRTIVKQRWIESSQNDYFGRADFGEINIEPITELQTRQILDALEKEKPDVLILSDYNKKIFRTNLAKSLIELANKNNFPTVIDPKPKNIKSFQNATLLCHNLKEAKEVIGDEYNTMNIEEVVKKLKNITGINSLTVTCGAEGMVTYDGQFHKIPTRSREIADVTGAGDTTTAVIALALAANTTLPESAFIANVAAGIVCNKTGTATVTQKRLINEILRRE